MDGEMIFMSWRSVLLVEETGEPGENHRAAASTKSQQVAIFSSSFFLFFVCLFFLLFFLVNRKNILSYIIYREWMVYLISVLFFCN